MTMPIIPVRQILAGLRRHRLIAALLALQVAATGAIVSNAVAMVAERVARIQVGSGLPERELSLLSVRGLSTATDPLAQQNSDLAALRRIPGLRAAAAVDGTLPLSGGANDSGGCVNQQTLDAAIGARSLENRPGCAMSTTYSGSPGFTTALGVRIIAGRDFDPLDYGRAHGTSIIVSESLAKLLWPGKSPVGQRLYGGGAPQVVIGVMADLLRPRLRSPAEDHLVLLSPLQPEGASATYLLRSAPNDRQRVLDEAATVLRTSSALRLIPTDRQRTFSQLRKIYFQRDSSMLTLLVASSLALLFVTALGIGGLASFWVGQRTRQIGIRRSLGATRGDIKWHFHAENLVIVGAASILGMMLAWLLGLVLASRYMLPELPLRYPLLCALSLLALGQLAVLWPARRAAAVPPAVATRSA